MLQLRDPQTTIGELGTVGEFWQWAFSDLLNNTTRGVLAEYIVGKLLGLSMSSPRVAWDTYDLLYREHKIEVKSSSYRQSWHGEGKMSSINFGVGEKMPDSSISIEGTPIKQRHADIYVFCVFPLQPDDYSRDVLNVDQWAFYACTTVHLNTTLPPNSKNITLAKAIQLCGQRVLADGLKARIDDIING